MVGRAGTLTPDSFNNFGELLRFLRERADLSQRELALQVGYHYSYMSRVEKNERLPDTATLMARFVPALGLEDEPRWTERLLRLAASEEKTMAPRKSGLNSTSPSTKMDSALPLLESPLSRLPLSLTPLLGREKEVETVTKLLMRFDVRLVTLVGPPGVGKTRLAIHVANEVAGMFAQGAVFLDLAPLHDPEEMLTALANTLGIQETSGASLMSHLVGNLRQKNMLLVIDNFEHLLSAAPQLVQLLGNSPQIKALITSREALRVTGEREFSVLPLPLPQKDEGDSPLESSRLIDYAAIQLFAQRAQAVDHEFQLTPENLNAIAEICRRLDGLPLAIELAAARSKILTPQAMLTQFDRRLDWVAHGARDSSNTSRQTLRGAIEWSYNILSEAERALMRRLAVFSDGWTTQSAEAVCGWEGSDPNPILKRTEVLDLLIQLADKSLVITEKQEHETRFRFLETIHDFTREKIKNSEEEVVARNKYLAYYADFAEEMERHIDGFDQVEWAITGDQEHNNLRAALEWGLHPEAEISDALRLAASVSMFWIARSYFREGFERLTAYLNCAIQPEHRALQAKILFRAGAMANYMFDFATGRKLCEEAILLARGLGEKRSLANALYYLGEILLNLGQYPEAHKAFEESISLCWEENYPSQLSVSLTSLGMLLSHEGDYERAQSMLEEALAIATRINNMWGMSHALLNLGGVNRYHNHYDAAIHYLERSLEMTTKIGDRHSEGVSYSNLAILYVLREEYAKAGHAAEKAFAVFQTIGDEVQQPFPLRMMAYAAIHAGNFVRARVLIQESLRGNRSLEDIPGQLACVVAFARCCFGEKDFTRAISLCALVETLMNQDNVKLLEPDQKALQEVLTQGKRKLGKSKYEAAYSDGKSLSLDEQVLKLIYT
jgi:predicted ATPase/transcriptional regulator with XRE-family HTH domain